MSGRRAIAAELTACVLAPPSARPRGMPHELAPPGPRQGNPGCHLPRVRNGSPRLPSAGVPDGRDAGRPRGPVLRGSGGAEYVGGNGIRGSLLEDGMANRVGRGTLRAVHTARTRGHDAPESPAPSQRLRSITPPPSPRYSSATTVATNAPREASGSAVRHAQRLRCRRRYRNGTVRRWSQPSHSRHRPRGARRPASRRTPHRSRNARTARPAVHECVRPAP